jgi:hypothetical protein
MRKIYSERQINFTGFLGGPLVAAYFLSQNFKTLGQKEKTVQPWIGASVLMVVFLALSISAPDMRKAIPLTLPLMMASLVSWYCRKYQSDGIGAYVNKGGEVQGWVEVISIVIIGFLFTAVIIFGLLLLTKQLLPDLDPSSGHGRLNIPK